MMTLLILVFSFQVASNDSESVDQLGLISVSAGDFTEKLKTYQPVLIDIRTPEEYAEGHLPNSLNMDFNSQEFVSAIDQLDRESFYAIYCRSGRRSGRALELMERKGFKNVIELSGGINAWRTNDATHDRGR